MATKVNRIQQVTLIPTLMKEYGTQIFTNRDSFSSHATALSVKIHLK